MGGDLSVASRRRKYVAASSLSVGSADCNFIKYSGIFSSVLLGRSMKDECALAALEAISSHSASSVLRRCRFARSNRLSLRN